jgi:hypothetical protein
VQGSCLIGSGSDRCGADKACMLAEQPQLGMLLLRARVYHNCLLLAPQAVALVMVRCFGGVVSGCTAP